MSELQDLTSVSESVHIEITPVPPAAAETLSDGFTEGDWGVGADEVPEALCDVENPDICESCT